MNEVWKFFDSIHLPVDTYQPVVEVPVTPRSIQIARDFNNHIQGVMNFQGTREERLKREWVHYQKLDAKYPELRVLAQVENEKRFIGVK